MASVSKNRLAEGRALAHHPFGNTLAPGWAAPCSSPFPGTGGWKAGPRSVSPSRLAPCPAAGANTLRKAREAAGESGWAPSAPCPWRCPPPACSAAPQLVTCPLPPQKFKPSRCWEVIRGFRSREDFSARGNGRPLKGDGAEMQGGCGAPCTPPNPLCCPCARFPAGPADNKARL